MKAIIKISFICVLILMFITPELFAVVRPADPGNTVAVPLDGGLLAILAGAGLGYFAARSKKKKGK
jgi:hypothetical protein